MAHAPFSHLEFAILLAALTTFAIACIAFVWGNKRPLCNAFSLYTWTICFWALGYFIFLTVDSYTAKLFFMRLLNIPAVFIPPTFLVFVMKLTNEEGNPFWIKMKRVSIMMASCLAILMFHRWFIPSLSPKAGFRFYLDAGPIYYVFNAWFVFSIGTCFFLLIKKFKQSREEKRKQLSYVILAYFIGYGGGTTVFLPVYGIPQPISALYAVSIAQGLLFYSIVTHKLLNLQIFVRRASLLFLIYAALLLLTMPAVYYLKLHSDLASMKITELFYLNVFVIAGALSAGPFIYAYFIRRSSFFSDHALAGLTHELKSPLAVIESALSAMNAQAIAAESNLHRSSPNQSDYLEMISRNVTRLKGSVQDLLDLYAVPNITQSLNLKEVDIVTLSKTVFASYQERAAQTKNELHFHSTLENFPMRCDPTKIEQTLSNLLSNSLKYTENGKVHLTISKRQDDVSIAITDTGRGIPKEDLPKIFDRFFQGRNAGQGSGIGLTIAKAWVEAHSGTIWAESEGEGKGATVVFTVPLGL